MSDSNRKNNNDNQTSGNGTNTITDFLRKNAKYISAGAVIVALAVVLAVTAGNKKDDSNKQGKAEVQQEEENKEQPEVKKEEYEVDVQPEMKELISTYYNSYASGDIEKLESVTKSLSDMEKSYVDMMKDHVESYSDINCYSKEGLDKGSYMVSATFNMNFSGLEGGLPGMDFFYVRTDEGGKLYIDNLYSSFNRKMREQDTEKEIDELIEAFEKGEDVKQLVAEFQEKYEKAVKENEELKKKAESVAQAIKDWSNTYTADAGQEDKKEDEKKDDKKDEKKEEEKKEEKKEEKQEEKKEEEKKEEPTETADANTDNQEQQPEESASQEETNDTSGINYVPEGKVLTANNGYNVRKSMSESAELIGTTAVGDSIKVILSYAEGWTKVEWNEKTGYIRTDLLLNN